MATLYWLQGVRVLNAHSQTDQLQHVLISDTGDLVASCPVGQTLAHADLASATVVNGEGKWLTPALVDMCARLREPGHQQHGSLASEGAAARNSGFYHVIMPPDTDPVLESGPLLQGLRDKARSDGGIYLHVLGALSEGLAGKKPANLAALKKGGAIAVSNANADFANHAVLYSLLQYAASYNLMVVFYPEDSALAQGGCVHDGHTATKLGLPAITPLAEIIALQSQLQLVEAVGVKAHFGQLSCAKSVALIAAAKARGAKVSADVALHQLLLNDTAIDGFNADCHVRPPLRDESDRLALLQGLQDGAIDAICSHHQPLTPSARHAPFADTKPGISSLDAFIPLSLQLVHSGLLSPLQWLATLTSAPQRITGLELACQQAGGYVLIDPQYSWVLSPDNMRSQGKNTPFMGMQLKGKVERVFFK